MQVTANLAYRLWSGYLSSRSVDCRTVIAVLRAAAQLDKISRICLGLSFLTRIYICFISLSSSLQGIWKKQKEGQKHCIC